MSSTPERLLDAATEQFAAKGYDGASVRAICAAAEANLNAVRYHFEGKNGLYNAVLRSIGDQRLASAMRILRTPATGPEDLKARLLLFAEETLVAWLASPALLTILYNELRRGFPHCDADAMASITEQNVVLVGFLQAAADNNLLREGIDIDILAGSLLERLNNQVVFVDVVQAQVGTSIQVPAYRTHWVRQTIELLLHGAA